MSLVQYVSYTPNGEITSLIEGLADVVVAPEGEAYLTLVDEDNFVDDAGDYYVDVGTLTLVLIPVIPDETNYTFNYDAKSWDYTPVSPQSEIPIPHMYDPDEDRMMFWDDDQEVFDWVTLGPSMEFIDGVLDTAVIDPADYPEAVLIDGTRAMTGALDIAVDDAVDDAVTTVLTVAHTVNVSPSDGIGVAMNYAVETIGSTHVGGQIRVTATTVADTFQDFDMLFSLMENEAAVGERFRITHDGKLVQTYGADTVTHTLDGTDYTQTFSGVDGATVGLGLAGNFILESGNVIFSNRDLVIRDGKTLWIDSADNLEYVAFSHNGTDFNTAATNTTDWNITGLTGGVHLDYATGGTHLSITNSEATQFGGSDIVIQKDRTAGLILTNDEIGAIRWSGHDGSVYQPSAEILVTAMGTVAAGFVPGRMRFYLADAAGTLTSLLELDGVNQVVAPAYPIRVANNTTAANPSYSFSSQTDMGFFKYTSLANRLNVAIVGTEVANWQSSAYYLKDIRLVIEGSSASNNMYLEHDDTDVNMVCASAADWNITGLTGGMRLTQGDSTSAITRATASVTGAKAPLVIATTTTGTALDDFGVRVVYQIENDAGTLRSYGLTDFIATDVSDGLESGDFVLSLMDGGAAAAEVLRVSSPGLHTNKTETGITAFATGGQASATQLTGSYNVIATVTTAGDSVKLPTAVVGRVIWILNNDSTDACDVFPFSGDDLGAGTNTASSLTAGANVTYRAIDANTWVVVT